MSGNVLDDSFETGSTALQTSDQPSQRAVFALGFDDLLVNVGKHNLDGPDDSKKNGSKGNCSYVGEKSPSESSANWAVQLLSVWSEVPDTGDCSQNKLTNSVDESNVPQTSEQMVVPGVSKFLENENAKNE
jgi:hypothetical protein